MGEPVTVNMPLDVMLTIRQVLKECADDLVAELDCRYPQNLRDKYPTYLRRYTNDMVTVYAARDLVDVTNGKPWANVNAEGKT